MKGFFIVSLSAIAMMGCSNKQMYEAGMNNHRFECQKLSIKEQQACLEEFNAPYDTYEQEREEYLQEKRE